MVRKSIFTLALVAIATAGMLLLAACGGGSSANGTPTGGAA